MDLAAGEAMDEPAVDGADARSSSQRIFAPGNIGSIGRPVSAMTRSEWPFSISSAQSCAVRRHCQLSTGPSGSPVSPSQMVTDSRWLEMAMAATSTVEGAAARQAEIASQTEAQMRCGSCSTQPGCG